MGQCNISFWGDKKICSIIVFSGPLTGTIVPIHGTPLLHYNWHIDFTDSLTYQTSKVFTAGLKIFVHIGLGVQKIEKQKICLIEEKKC